MLEASTGRFLMSRNRSRDKNTLRQLEDFYRFTFGCRKRRKVLADDELASVIAWWTESALVLLIMLIHWRVVKQIVQFEFVLVHLRRTTPGSTPPGVECREVIATALVVALT